MVFRWGEPKFTPATAGGGGFDRAGAGNGEFDARARNERGNGAGKGKIGGEARIAGRYGNKPTRPMNQSGHGGGGNGKCLGRGPLEGVGGRANVGLLQCKRARAGADVFGCPERVQGAFCEGMGFVRRNENKRAVMAGKVSSRNAHRTDPGIPAMAAAKIKISQRSEITQVQGRDLIAIGVKGAQRFASSQLQGDKLVHGAIEGLEAVPSGEVEGGEQVAVAAQGLEARQGSDIKRGETIFCKDKGFQRGKPREVERNQVIETTVKFLQGRQPWNAERGKVVAGTNEDRDLAGGGRIGRTCA